MGKRQIQKTLKIFAERAKRGLRAREVLLFGSWARGQANKFSDIDIVVLSDVFTHVPQEKRLDLLYPLTRGLFPDIHPLGYTPEEFARASKLSSLAEIKQTGIAVS